MATSMLVKVTCLVMICMVMGVPLANAALSCGQLQLTIAPCIGYIRRPGPSVPAPCCNAIRTINNQAKTIPDRQGACRCLKSTALSIPGINVPALAGAPSKCGVNLPFKVTPSIDCNTVKY